MPTARHIYSVTELNSEAKMALENGLGLAWIEAEISNISRPASGHWYFTLKDKKSQIRCAFFKGRNRLVNFSPEDGQLLLVRGRVSLYEPRGDYQLIVDHIEPAGQGDLQKAFEEIKQRLHAAGLFDEEYKQVLPAIPRRIGLITSPTGAAIRDVLNVLKRRFPVAPVIIYPTVVQGESAASQIIEALKLAIKRDECDVLLLVRGGGSLEDLWPFNNEDLIKTIFDCPIPVISGVGHEIDFTITDFVADVRAPTPSAAAELVTPSKAELGKLLQQQQNSLIKHIGDILQNLGQEIDWYTKHLLQLHPGKKLSAQRDQLKSLSRRLQQSMRIKLDSDWQMVTQLHKRTQALSPIKITRQFRDKIITLYRQLENEINNKITLSRYRLKDSTHALNTVSPIATLSRGYSISRHINSNKPVTQANQLNKGDIMETRLAKGRVTSKIESIDE